MTALDSHLALGVRPAPRSGPARMATDLGGRVLHWQFQKALGGRITAGLLTVSLALNAVSVIGNGSKQAREYAAHGVSAVHVTNALVQLGFASLLFATIAGALLPLMDFRDRTVGRSALVAGGVRPLLAAQLTASVPVGVLFGLVGVASASATAYAVSRVHHIPFVVDRSTVLSMLGVFLVSVLAAPWGVLIGWIGRRMTVTLAAIIVWILVAEGAINAVAPSVWKWLPDGAQAGIYRDVTTSHLSMLPGLAVFVAWMVVAAVVCRSRLTRTDLL